MSTVGRQSIGRYNLSVNTCLPTALLALAVFGCSSEPIKDAETPEAGETTAAAAERVATETLGKGSPASNSVVELYQPALRVPLSATSLAFNRATPNELWLTLRQFPSGKACTERDPSGCAALPGVVAILSEATGPEPQVEIKEDGNSWHFMRRPTAIAWGDGELFATCGEARTDNFEDLEIPYAGPALWSSNPEIFGVEPTRDQNGTHLDMLHETPYCMGVAHESGNAYWAVNGEVGSLDRYDFHAPHQIGGEDHDDGEVYRCLLYTSDAADE